MALTFISLKLRGWTIATLICFAALCARPLVGHAITAAEEEKLRKKFLVEVKKQFQIIDDPNITQYINQLGQKIVQQLPPQPFKYRFHLIEESTYNAFAGPGAVIFINTGLLAAMEHEDELAGILCHEVIHVYSRHISDRIERSKKVGVVTLAGLVAAIALGAAGGGAAANAAAIGSIAAGQTMELAYSREDEIQADQLGLQVLAKVGYSAQGLLEIMEKIRAQQWFGSNQVPGYLRTHPAAEERVVYIANWIDAHTDTGSQTVQKRDLDPYRFNKIRNIVQAKYSDQATARVHFENKLRTPSPDPLDHYGLGLVMERSGEYDEAIIQLRKALKKNAFDADLLADLGRIYFKGRRYSEATATLKGALSIDPGHVESRYFLGRTQLELGDNSSAVENLEKVARYNEDYLDTAYFLGSAYGREGNMAEAHYLLGRYYMEKGEIQTATVQLTQALEKTSNPDRRKEIEELLEELRRRQPPPPKPSG
jgi:predicted Zn-dependent protease